MNYNLKTTHSRSFADAFLTPEVIDKVSHSLGRSIPACVSLSMHATISPIIVASVSILVVIAKSIM